MRTSTTLALCCATVSALALSACGSDDSSSAAPAAAVEASAAAPVADEHAGHHGGESVATGSTAESTAAEGGHDHSSHDHGGLTIAESGVGRVLEVGDGHGNLLREAPSDARPAVSLRVKADPAGGWTVRVSTPGFRWAPEDVNTPADAASGHAHLYVGATKVARIYGEWVFVPGTAAEAGDTLSAVLYADDHSAWAVDGKPVEAEVVLPAVSA